MKRAIDGLPPVAQDRTLLAVLVGMLREVDRGRYTDRWSLVRRLEGILQRHTCKTAGRERGTAERDRVCF